jgi:hypothetical protein
VSGRGGDSSAGSKAAVRSKSNGATRGEREGRGGGDAGAEGTATRAMKGRRHGPWKESAGEGRGMSDGVVHGPRGLASETCVYMRVKSETRKIQVRDEICT